ncbi:MAG: tRNA-dihydrouridine synthase family protein [Rhabdochlamydiaceae bacterium]|jgi:tRNA-dihydrouridine synthase C
MKLLEKDSYGCPYLILAPMEGVGDPSFRAAMASVGGFDEAVTEFLRVPINAHIPSLAKHYNAEELAPTPLAVQLMGSDPHLMALMAQEMERKKAPRIDINCGCPSNTVTGKGAGSSLLKDPNFLYQVAHSVVKAVKTPVTIKMRSGYTDISLFKENLLAAQESGVSFITLHPRTKVDGYGPPARWDLIAEAKSILKIPLVGNGDILTVPDALKMLQQTRCDALMIGRGSIINPFIFQQIRAHFSQTTYAIDPESLETYFTRFISKMPPHMTPRGRLGKIKQLMSFFFKATPTLLAKRQEVLAAKHETMELLLAYVLPILKETLIPILTDKPTL